MTQKTVHRFILSLLLISLPAVVQEILTAESLGESLRVHRGDLVYVPEDFISKIKPFAPISSTALYVPGF